VAETCHPQHNKQDTRQLCFDVPHPSLIAYNTKGMMHLKIISTFVIPSVRYRGCYLVLAGLRQFKLLGVICRNNDTIQWRTQEFCSGGGSTNSVADRENGDLGTVRVRGSGGSCNLVLEISFHIVKFS